MSECLAENPVAIDPKALRSALGAFSTGVTIVTTLDEAALPVGVTANSFSSVSLDPPLILWSLAKSARSHAAYNAARHWVVNVLSLDQVDISNRFAQRGEDKFAGVNVTPGLAGVPTLDGHAACFQCETWARYDGGDHTIFVGKVLKFDRTPEPPLVFQEGKYAVATPKVDTLAFALETAHLSASGLGEDLLGYLLLRSYAQFHGTLRQHLQDIQLQDLEFLTLVTLLHRGALPIDEIELTLLSAGYAVDDSLYQSLVERQWAVWGDGVAGNPLGLTDSGREMALLALEKAKNIEAEFVSKLGAADTASLKNLLRRFIVQRMDAGH